MLQSNTIRKSLHIESVERFKVAQTRVGLRLRGPEKETFCRPGFQLQAHLHGESFVCKVYQGLAGLLG